jgi:hypothetical protein
MGGFKPVPLDQLPIPQAAPPTQFQPAQIENPPSQQPPGAGSMGAGGKIADVASNFLTGWLKGKQQAEQKKLAMAQQNMEGLHYGFQIAQQNAAQVANDPNATPDAKAKSEQARQAAWKAYLDGAEPYTQQPKGAGKSSGGGKGQGGGIKDHMKAAFGAEDPHIFSQGAMALLRKTGPPSLPQKGAEDQLAELQLKGQKNVQAQIDNLVKVRQSGGTPEQIQAAEAAVRDAQGQTETPGQKLQDSMAQATTAYMAGKPISDQAKQVLESQGYIPKPIMPSMFLQDDGKGHLYAVSVDPTDPNKTKKSDRPVMNMKVAPDARQETQQIFEQNLKQLGSMLKDAHPDWSEEQVKQAQAQAMLSGKFGIKTARGMTMGQSQTAVSKALNEVVNTMLDPDEKAAADTVLSRAQGIGGGGYMFRKDFKDADGMKGWWDSHDFWVGQKKHNGMTEEQANDLDQKVRNYTRQIMRDKMGMDQDQVDALVPQSMQDERLKLGMDATPDEAAGGGSKDKTATMDQVKEYAQIHGISVEEATQKVKAEGYDVK